jgi:outer membrane protein OmpA-like peptidoglycan-associated protein
MTKTRVVALAVSVCLSGTSACATNAQTGAAVGAAGGAVAGAAIGNAAGNTVAGAILGAAIGGAAGTVIGHYMDRQAAEIERDIEGARVERIGEGIKITFDSGILFAFNSADLQYEAVENLNELARILNKYEDTNILIEGHTDAVGSEDYNLGLSRRRAESVSVQLDHMSVDEGRFTLMAYGESQPIATNETDDGRRANRRVEVAIMANDKLKKAAQQEIGAGW